MKPPDLPLDGFQDKAKKLRESRPPVEAEPVTIVPLDADRSTELFDTTVRRRGGFPFMAILFACATLGFVGFAVSVEPAVAYLAATCACISAALYWGYRQKIAYHFTAEGIEFVLGRKRKVMRYDEILEIFVRPRDRARERFPIYLLTADGFEILPAKLSLDSRSLLDFLVTQPLGQRHFGEVPAVFNKFLRQQRALYPASDIYVYTARARVDARQKRWNFCHLLGIGLSASAPVYIAGSFFAGRDFVPLLGVGIMFVVLGIVMFLVGILIAQPTANLPRIKNWKNALLIVGPGGVALSAADLQGELRWEELVSLNFVPGGKVTFKVAGAAIEVVDIFLWPIDHIGELCERFHSEKKDGVR